MTPTISSSARFFIFCFILFDFFFHIHLTIYVYDCMPVFRFRGTGGFQWGTGKGRFRWIFENSTSKMASKCLAKKVLFFFWWIFYAGFHFPFLFEFRCFGAEIRTVLQKHDNTIIMMIIFIFVSVLFFFRFRLFYIIFIFKRGFPIFGFIQLCLWWLSNLRFGCLWALILADLF